MDASFCCNSLHPVIYSVELGLSYQGETGKSRFLRTEALPEFAHLHKRFVICSETFASLVYRQEVLPALSTAPGSAP